MSGNEKVLVTGAAGYIGSHVVLALLEAGYRPVVLDSLSTGHREMVPAEVSFVEGEAGDEAAVAALIAREGCRAVMHFAGSIQVAESVADPLKYYRNNVATTISLLRACQLQGLQAFIFSSTAAVYQSRTDRPLKEDDKLAPASPYGRSKLMVEQLLADAAEAYGLRQVVLRYFNVAGADPKLRAGQCGAEATHLIKRACLAATGVLPEIGVFGTDYDTADGTCVRDYIHVADLATAHVVALDHLLRDNGAGGTFNCGYGRGYSVLEVLDAVDRQLDQPLQRKLALRRPGDPASLIADSTRLRETLDWRPEHDDLDHIVATALAWERKLRSARGG